MKKLLVLLLAVLPLVTADPLYVKSKYARMRKHPKNSQGTTKVTRGEKMDKLAYRSKWYKVKYKGKRRWIYRGKISKSAPVADKSLTAKGGKMDPREAEKLAASSAARGLDDLSKNFAKKHKISEQHRIFADYQQSYILVSKKENAPKVDQRGVVPFFIEMDKVDNFVDEGQLGAPKEGDFDNVTEEE